MTDLEAQRITALSDTVWRRGEGEGSRLAALRSALALEHPLAWALAQAVELLHPVSSAREEARQANERWARERGLPPHLWGDRVAARGPADPARPDRYWRTQRRRLEVALCRQWVWPRGALARIVQDREPVHLQVRALLWISEREQLCRLDADGQPRGLDGRVAQARALRLAHPAQRALRAQGRLLERVDGAEAPFPQLARERFGPEDLELDGTGWYRPRWREPLPLFRLLRDLRRIGGWRLTDGEDNGTVAGFFLHDARADLTALWRLMNPQDQPNYGYMLYGPFHPPDTAVRVGLLLLRGAWDRARIGWSYGWPPKRAPYFNIQPEHLCEPRDADPIFLSELLRDVWAVRAVEPRPAGA